MTATDLSTTEQKEKQEKLKLNTKDHCSPLRKQFQVLMFPLQIFSKAEHFNTLSRKIRPAQKPKDYLHTHFLPYLDLALLTFWHIVL